MSMLRNVVIYTDGACSGNPGPGGWATLLRFGKSEKVLSGGLPQTTNNRMELQAVAEGLAALKAPCTVVVKSDSRYVVTSLMIYMYDWEKRGWKKSDGNEVAHSDLWKQIFEASKTHRILPVWVKGHGSDPDNQRVDQLARSAIPSAVASGTQAAAA